MLYGFRMGMSKVINRMKDGRKVLLFVLRRIKDSSSAFHLEINNTQRPYYSDSAPFARAILVLQIWRIGASQENIQSLK